jgi:hypothetical protein
MNNQEKQDFINLIGKYTKALDLLCKANGLIWRNCIEPINKNELLSKEEIDYIHKEIKAYLVAELGADPHRASQLRKDMLKYIKVDDE